MNISTENRALLRETGLALIALILIAGALSLTFSHVLQSGPEDIAGRYDIFRYYGPITFYLDYCISQGELPLWNPLVYCGLPNAANPQAFVFYPPNLVRSLLLREISPQATSESLVIFVGLHLLLMGFCTYLLSRAHRLSFPGALVASLAWVCSALIVRRACEYHFLYTMAWLPLILILVKCAIDTRHGRLKIALSLIAGAVFGLSILGGFLQIVSYMGVCIALYALFYRVAESANVGDGWKARLRLLGLDDISFSVILLVAGLTAMVLLLSTVELAPYSARDKGTSVKMYSDLMKWNISHLYQSLVVYPGMKWEPETIRTAGITVFLLVAAGCFNRRRKMMALFGLLAYALIDCSFGPPFPMASLVNLVTPFSSSAYSRGFDFALLPLGLLAGLGVDTLIDAGRRHAGVRGLLALLIIYVAGATLVPLWDWINPHPFLPVNALVILVPGVALLVMLLILWMSRWRKVSYVLACLLPLLLVGETFAWNYSFVPWMIKRHLKETPPLQSGHHFPNENRRFTAAIPNRSLYSLHPAMNGVDPLHLADMRILVSGQFREKMNKREVRDWEPTAENARGNLFLKRFFWLASAYSEDPVPGKQALFSPTEVVYLDAPPGNGIPVYREAPREHLSVSKGAIRIDIPNVAALKTHTGIKQRHTLHLTLPAALVGAAAGPAGAPHATLVYEYASTVSAQVDTVFTDKDSGLVQWGLRHRIKPTRSGGGRIEVPIPDMRQSKAALTVIGQGRGKFQITDAYIMADPNDEDGKLTMKSFSANRVSLAVAPTEGPRLLLFLDAWYPGWTAHIDGEPVPILRANGAFKAIALPAGAHDVVFEFRPRTIYIGFGVSAASTLLVLVVAAWLLARNRRRKSITPNASRGGTELPATSPAPTTLD